MNIRLSQWTENRGCEILSPLSLGQSWTIKECMVDVAALQSNHPVLCKVNHFIREIHNWGGLEKFLVARSTASTLSNLVPLK